MRMELPVGTSSVSQAVYCRLLSKLRMIKKVYVAGVLMVRMSGVIVGLTNSNAPATLMSAHASSHRYFEFVFLIFIIYY